MGQASSALVRGASTPGRASRGIYAGRQVLSGNSISFSDHRTKRRWLPNVHRKYFYSHLLQEWLRIRITTHALRCIEKSGGIDDYILYTKPKNLADSELALSLRTRLIGAWEAQHQSTFDRRRIVYERLVAESAKQQALATATAGATTSTSTATSTSTSTEDDGSSAAVNHAA